MTDDERIEELVTDWATQARADDQRSRLAERAYSVQRDNELRTLASTLLGAGSHEMPVSIATRANTNVSGVPTNVGKDCAWLQLLDGVRALVRYDSIVSIQLALDPARWPAGTAPNDDSAEDARFEFRAEIASLAESRATVNVETEDGQTKHVTLWGVSDELVVGDSSVAQSPVRLMVTIAIQSVAVVRVSG
jgi:hypothetical protein